VTICHWCHADLRSDDDAVAVVTGEHAGESMHKTCLDALRRTSLDELRQLSFDSAP
jgi:hypothetical protein